MKGTRSKMKILEQDIEKTKILFRIDKYVYAAIQDLAKEQGKSATLLMNEILEKETREYRDRKSVEKFGKRLLEIDEERTKGIKHYF